MRWKPCRCGYLMPPGVCYQCVSPPQAPSLHAAAFGCTGVGEAEVCKGDFDADTRSYWYAPKNTYTVFYNHGADRLRMDVNGPRCTATDALASTAEVRGG